MLHSIHDVGVGVYGQNICFEVNAKFDQDLLQLVSHSCLYFFLGRKDYIQKSCKPYFKDPYHFLVLPFP